MIYDIAIVGGGIVGLATARELALRFPRIRVAGIEKERAFNGHQTGRNSGVIHSGIYYKPGSLKARLCVEGRRATYAYCDERAIPYKRVGKLIVATDESEFERLDELWSRGVRNGVEGLAMLDARGIAAREPHCRGLRAISSPETGIVDWSRVAASYADDALEAGADFYLGCEVTSIERRGAVIRVHTPERTIEARHVITCAGLHADTLARMTGGARDPKIIPFRGDYLVLRADRSGLVAGNVYPVPDPEFPFLGVHFTPRMNGEIWLGPNAVLAFAREGYSFFDINPPELWDAVTYPGFFKLATTYWRIGMMEMYRDLVRAAYVRALQRYLPELTPDDCLPGPAGVRAQAMNADGSLVDDFVFEGSDAILHVRNAPSPAATSSLAIGAAIVDDAQSRFALRPAVASG